VGQRFTLAGALQHRKLFHLRDRTMRTITFTSCGSGLPTLKRSGASLFVLSGATFSLAYVASAPRCRAADDRNPFGVMDVANPDGDDVQAFAKRAQLPGGNKDDNAPQWSEKMTEGVADSLDGEWFCRWSSGGGANTSWYCGTATVRTIKDRVYILCKDETGTFLIDTLRKGNQLVGRYNCVVGNSSDSTPWVGMIVDNERIDGCWGGGRWDLRRQLFPPRDERPKPIRK
jgi:hypothetical protein